MLLKASKISASAWIAVRDYRHVPELAGHSHESVQHFAAGNDSSSDAGPERQQDQVVVVPSGPHPLLTQGGVYITLEIQNLLTSETQQTQPGLAQALALAMVVIVVIVMTFYTLLQRRTSRWLR